MQNRESSTSEILFENQVILELSYFARNIYETEALTSALPWLYRRLNLS